MIAGLRGTIAALEPQAVVIDLHGFRLRVAMSSRALASLGTPGDPVEILTHLVVREDQLALYGFPEQAELDFFLLLIAVNGVGPRVALNLLSFTDISTLYQAIANEDVALLSKAPGIGKATASRIVFDLKRKLGDIAPLLGQPGAPATRDAADQDALAALEALGYSLLEARNALASLEGRAGMTPEERVFAALQRLASS
ncbi:MAG: Holliday junction branch migration protein RuvA [Chloroflexi bacterium]|nr:MAG: Holliday junction branch migration protein RuvA [Chloroflexota bacterium]